MKNGALHRLHQSHHSPERSLIIMNNLPADADCEERIEVNSGNLMRRNVLRRKGSVVQPRRSLSVGLGGPDPPFVVVAAAATDRRSVSMVVVERLSVEPLQNTARRYRGTRDNATHE